MMTLRCAMVAAAAVIAACSNSGSEQSRLDQPAQPVAASPDAGAAADEILAQPQDSVIVEEKLAWARAQRLDTLPIGEVIARLGRTFVGAPYTPGTLEAPGPERLVVNLREFDCVTFVENMLSLARTLRAGGGYPEFTRELRRIRYRGGTQAGYPSRLHYFSEWIADNTAKSVVRDLTRELGGPQDTRPIDFMTSHAQSYRQLAEPGVTDTIRAIETRLSATPRYVVPETGIGSVASRIRDGDIIGAASSLPGLDIAHTGIALWVDGKLHLMHAPLVGSVVEISKAPLAERILAIEKQNGIMIARPQ